MQHLIRLAVLIGIPVATAAFVAAGLEILSRLDAPTAVTAAGAILFAMVQAVVMMRRTLISRQWA